jgi:NADH:ubiquinone oxidoreductase subunit 3 (subunit A)
MTTFIAVMALLTATVIMVTKIVELVSAIRKQRAEAKTPADVIAASSANRPTSRLPFVLWLHIVVMVFGMFSLGYLLLVPSPTGTLTRQDVAWIGMLVATYVVASLQRYDRAA